MKPGTASVIVSGTTNVETVHVARGQFVTVWLNGNQVELRVREDGTEEIFLHEGSVTIRDFSEWERATSVAR